MTGKRFSFLAMYLANVNKEAPGAKYSEQFAKDCKALIEFGNKHEPEEMAERLTEQIHGKT